jgi:hypothetical protein
VTFFYVFSDMLLALLPAEGIFEALISGALEISCGFSRLASLGAGVAWRYFCGGAILGFGGFSVFLQSADAAGDGGFRAGKYLAGKTAQGLLCGALAAAIGALCESAYAREVFLFFGSEQGKIASLWQMLALFCLIFAILTLQIKIFAKIFKKLWKKSNL